MISWSSGFEQPIMNSSETFGLKWNDYITNITSSYAEFRQDPNFADVTLVSQDNKKIEAHKVVLASGSKFFKTMLSLNQHPHPLIYMRNISTKDLETAVTFLYQGEVNILQEDLDNFLTLAEELQLKGLSGPKETSKYDETAKQQPRNNYKEPRKEQDIHRLGSEISTPPTQESRYIENNSHAVSLVGAEASTKSPVSFRDGNEELDTQITSMMTKVEGRTWACTVCGKRDQNVNIKKHIESHHIKSVPRSCNICGKIFRLKDTLLKHIHKNHINKYLQS